MAFGLTSAGLFAAGRKDYPNLLSILNTGMSAIGWALLHTTVMSCDMIVANSGGLSGAIGHALLKRERYGA